MLLERLAPFCLCKILSFNENLGTEFICPFVMSIVLNLCDWVLGHVMVDVDLCPFVHFCHPAEMDLSRLVQRRLHTTALNMSSQYLVTYCV